MTLQIADRVTDLIGDWDAQQVCKSRSHVQSTQNNRAHRRENLPRDNSIKRAIEVLKTDLRDVFAAGLVVKYFNRHPPFVACIK